MSIFSKCKNFVSEHKNKFIAAAFVTGSVFLTKYAHKRLRDWQENQAIEFLERNRKQNHFESITRTCNQTILNLSSSLLDKIYENVDTDILIQKLKSNPEDKLRLWQTLRNKVFTETFCICYGLVVLVVTLKIQLNIMGGYLYKSPEHIPEDVQQKYLSLCQYFLNTGMNSIIKSMEVAVTASLEDISFTKPVTLGDIESIFWTIHYNLGKQEGSLDPTKHLKTLILGHDSRELKNDTYGNLIKMTEDLLECDEVVSFARQLVNESFVLLGNEMTKFFETNDPKEGFQNPWKIQKPFVKLLPILNSLLARQCFPTKLIDFLIHEEQIQSLCANIYECLLE
ncbi:hypothetical protein ABEB36_000910 [Hypothenemus hampei]|uniref:Peroxisomal biogenesis factor 3 n=1 Tax=Hypothenemus hampei TaxID=57062 RepID=A0ABD1FCW9_HYPHA